MNLLEDKSKRWGMLVEGGRTCAGSSGIIKRVDDDCPEGRRHELLIKLYTANLSSVSTHVGARARALTKAQMYV